MTEDIKTLTCWDFYDEIMKLPAQCKRIKGNSARIKADALYYKYEHLISYSKQVIERDDQEKMALRNIVKAFQTGTIEFKDGYLKISEILNVKKGPSRIEVITKGGYTEMFDSPSFDWLLKLFHYS